MQLNETLLMMMYTANIIANLPGQNNDVNFDKETNTTLEIDDDQHKFESDEEYHLWKCYHPYGCYYIGEPWSGGTRSSAHFPITPSEINPSYVLYNDKLIEEPQKLLIDDINLIKNSKLKKNENLFFIIHGYLDNGNKTWVQKLVREILIREDSNVIVVNWIDGAGPPYTQAVANIRLVGAMTARLAYQLIEHANVSPDRIHCIGHSLGAHTCGYLGHKLRIHYGYRLGKISGLDPAEPHFRNTPPLVRLDPTDAEFVSVMHTDNSPFISGGLGILQPIGHLDYYPNSGKHQPGCNEGVLNSITMEKGSLFRGLKRFLGCNHIRSYEYFIESVNSMCPYLSVPCSSWEDFTKGKCFDCVNTYCPRMGFDAQIGKKKAILYSMTGKTYPYCRAHYRIIVNMSKPEENLEEYGGEAGTFTIRIFGTKNKTEPINLSEAGEYYEPGTTHTHVIPGELIGIPKSAELSWEYQSSMFNPWSWRILHVPKVHVKSITIKCLEINTEITLCPENNKLVNTEVHSFKVEYCKSHSEINSITT